MKKENNHETYSHAYNDLRSGRIRRAHNPSGAISIELSPLKRPDSKRACRQKHIQSLGTTHVLSSNLLHQLAVLWCSRPRCKARHFAWFSSAQFGAKGLGNFGPTLSAIVITAYLFGRRGVRSLLARGCHWRLHVSWYVIALLLPFMTVIAGVELAYVLNGTTATPWIIVAPTSVGLLGVLVAPLGEELGWRGFALPRLQTRFGFLWASLLLGIIWGFWHLPFFFFPNSSNQRCLFSCFWPAV